MEYRPLGNTDLKVSSLCLGTMTWGNQNSAEEGFAQMDLALDRGINFFDTASGSPGPATATRWCWPPRPPARATT
jgi:aryl-alcohol dehydrogenase-like predicted oxidoreductase